MIEAQKFSQYKQLQKYFLLAATFLFLIVTPREWIVYPDSGYYVGTAENMLSKFQYWFNGQPNLLYYPGTSALLTLPMNLVGSNYWLLQLYVSLISLTALWAARQYFSIKEFGYIGLLVPVFLACSSIYISHIHALLSDGIFLTFSLLALLSWRTFTTTNNKYYLYVCIFLVGFSALIRFHGIFLCTALSISLFIKAIFIDKNSRKQGLSLALIASVIVFLPFIIWTIRNFYLHTPDTFNMANYKFFGLKGLSIYAKGLVGNVSGSWVDASWKYPFYRSALYFGSLAESWLGYFSLSHKVLMTPLIAGLIALGLKPWYKNATLLELFYVGISLAFIAKDIFFPNSLYMVARYWLPLLPFTILWFSLGIKVILTLPFFQRRQNPLRIMVMSSIVIVLIISTIINVNKFNKKAIQNKVIESSLIELQAFSLANIPEDSKVATMDWGVLPLTLQRESFPVLNDPEHHETIERMLKYNTEFLVIHGNFPRTSVSATELAIGNPEIFKLIYENHQDKSYAHTQVYKINLLRLDNLLQIKSRDVQ
jgi:hypothetical protein